MSQKLITKIGFYTIYESKTKDSTKYIVDSGKTVKLKNYNKVVINKNRDIKEFDTLKDSKTYIKLKLDKKTKEKQKKLSKLPKSLYLIVLKEESTQNLFVKVGITSKRFIMRRFSKAYGYDGYVIESILRRIDTPNAEKIEKEIKDILNKKRSVKKYRPILESFSGYSECYDYMSMDEIIKIFDDMTKSC
jgi:hypothetical protein